MTDYPSAATRYVGFLASGKRVYVREGRRRRRGLGRPLALAIFADERRDGRLRLVDRVEDVEHQTLRCINGESHDGPCCWVESVSLSAREYADTRVHWWRHVARATAEAVVLRPLGRRGAPDAPDARDRLDPVPGE